MIGSMSSAARNAWRSALLVKGLCFLLKMALTHSLGLTIMTSSRAFRVSRSKLSGEIQSLKWNSPDSTPAARTDTSGVGMKWISSTYAVRRPP